MKFIDLADSLQESRLNSWSFPICANPCNLFLNFGVNHVFFWLSIRFVYLASLQIVHNRAILHPKPDIVTIQIKNFKRVVCVKIAENLDYKK